MNRSLESSPHAARYTGQLVIGRGVYDLLSETLKDRDGKNIDLRPQSMQVLHQLALHEGQIVSKARLNAMVWPGITVTDDSVTRCVADIRKAIGDSDRRILKTIPKKGYRLQGAAGPAAASGGPDHGTPVGRGARRVIPATILALVALLAGGTWLALQRTAPDTVRIVVLPFQTDTEDARLTRLGRGISIDIAEELARTKALGVIGSESAYEAATMPLQEAADWLDATFVLDGDIAAIDEQLSLTAHLMDAANRRLLWSQTWTTPFASYAVMRDEIAQRASASISSHFWFGALNMAVAEKAAAKPRRHLSAYEAYLLGVSNVAWSKQDYEAAMAHFRRAVEIDPGYARAWMMIGVMLQWIGDVSAEERRMQLHADSHAAFEKAFLHAPHDAIVQTMMSVVYNDRGETDASRRAILRGVELAPNNPDVLAAAAWQALPSGLEGDAALGWARRAVALNPKGPPWHRLGIGIAAFLAGDYQAAIDAMEDAPPHHKKFAFLAASHIMNGDTKRAADAAATLMQNFPDYTLSGDYDLPTNPALDRFFQAALQAGVAR